MMTSRFPEFLAAAFLIELTPGPNMTWLALLAAQQGRRAGLTATAGIALGLSIVAVAAGIGLAAVLDRSPALYNVFRWAGAAFLLYLAVETWMGERASRSPLPSSPFLRGLLVNLLNPKAASVFLILIPGFLGAQAARTGDQLTYSAAYVAIATAVHSGIVLGASSLNDFLTHPARERTVRRTCAVALAAIAIWFLISTRH